MKHAIALLLALACAWPAAAVDTVRVKTTKQLANKRDSNDQQVFGGRTSLTEKEYVYRIDLQSIASQFANPAKVEWIVMMEDMSGRLKPAARGSVETSLALGRMASVTTMPVQINQRDWQGPHGRSGKIEDKIEGVAVRVLDQNGNVAVESYEPNSLKKEIDWKTASPDANQAGQDALKAIGGMMGGGGDRPPPPDRRDLKRELRRP